MQHNLWTAPLYRVLASVMTELKETGEIKPGFDESNVTSLVRWDARKKRYVYAPRPEER